MTDILVGASTSRYVTRDSEILQGEPIITGTKIAVRDIVKLWKLGVKPEDIPQTLMGLVTTAQVFDAISFYLDNQPEIDERLAWFAARPALDVSPTLRCNPLLDEVTEYVEAYRRERNAEMDSLNSEAS